MHLSDARKLATRLAERVRERLNIDEPLRVVLLFYVFVVMFGLLLVFSFRTAQLTGDRNRFRYSWAAATRTIAQY